MAARTFRLGTNRDPALDIVSYGLRGPNRQDRFSPSQLEQIGRTVRRAPEVMVTVSGGGTSPQAVLAHFRYISRRGELEIEAEDGEGYGEQATSELVDDWDLDLDAALDRWSYVERGGRVPKPKLVHNIVLSMPAGTSKDRLLAASREFAREEFGAQHRYAMVVHTDQNHPHVHLVISAHRLDGDRLNIRKADLRRWREEFARQLQRQGIAANATPAQTRGKLTDHQKDGVYRAVRRGASWLESERGDQARAEAAALDTNGGRPARNASLGRIFRTADDVQGDWLATVNALQRQGEWGLAMDVEQYRQSLRVPRTRLERAIGALRASTQERLQRHAEPIR